MRSPFIADFCASVMLVVCVILAGVTAVFVNALMLAAALKWLANLF
jgi:hypothetical protein